MLKILQSAPQETPFAPFWKAELYEASISDYNICNNLFDIILQKEKDIIKDNPSVQNDGGTGLGSNSLTSKFSSYNIFTWNEQPVQTFYKFVKKEYSNFLSVLELPNEKCMVQCWANVMRAGDKIEPHWHSSSPRTFLSAHFCVKTNNTETLYQNPYMPSEWISFPNKIGNIMFFPSWMVHTTSPVQENDVRVTIALDLVPVKFWDSTVQKNYIPFN